MNALPLRTGETACFAGGDDTLTIDPHGNMLTCQNFDASSRGENGETHCLGAVLGREEKQRPDLRSLASRCRAALAQAMPVRRDRLKKALTEARAGMKKAGPQTPPL